LRQYRQRAVEAFHCRRVQLEMKCRVDQAFDGSGIGWGANAIEGMLLNWYIGMN
jgi:hypothetical protein